MTEKHECDSCRVEAMNLTTAQTVVKDCEVKCDVRI